MRLLKTQNLQAISIESIAKEAGVGKATIYRWWPSKASVVIDAFIQNHIVHTPMPQGVSWREALAEHMRLLIEQYSGFGGRIVTQILAEGQANPDVLREFHERFMYGRRAVVRETLEEARRRGELPPDVDLDLQMDILYAPIYMRLVTGYSPLDQHFADTYPDTVLNLFDNKRASGRGTAKSAKKRSR